MTPATKIYEFIKKSPQLEQAIVKAANTEERLQLILGLAEDLDLDISPEAARDYLDSFENRELRDEDLEMVVGGKVAGYNADEAPEGKDKEPARNDKGTSDAGPHNDSTQQYDDLQGETTKHFTNVSLEIEEDGPICEEEMDSIRGAGGNDTMHGSEDHSGQRATESDTLVGGEGNDTFIFSGDPGNDIISDYKEGDAIWLYGITSTSQLSVDCVNDNTIITYEDNTIIVEDTTLTADEILEMQTWCS